MIKTIITTAMLAMLALTTSAHAANEDFTPPKPIQTAAPVYPQEMLNDCITGKVTLEFFITAEGTVEDVKVLKTDNEGFNTSAIACVKQWKFQPATEAGEAVPFKVRLPLSFSLTEKQISQISKQKATALEEQASAESE